MPVRVRGKGKPNKNETRSITRNKMSARNIVWRVRCGRDGMRKVGRAGVEEFEEDVK